MEQRYFIKCLYFSGDTPSDIIEKLADWFGDDAYKKTQVYFWIGEIKRGRKDLSDAPRSGRPRNEEIDSEINAILNLYQFASVRYMASIIQASTETIHRHLCDMGYKNVALRWIPHQLNPSQKVNRVRVSKILLKILENSRKNGFVDIITGDESWFIYYYQYDSKWVVETDTIPEKVKPNRYDRKTMLTIFIGIDGLVFRDVKPENMNMNSDYFINNILEPISKLDKVVNLQKSGKNCLIHFDNARCHTSQKVKTYLTQSPFTLVPHPVFSPDLAPCDFGLFGTMKNSFKGMTFDTEEDLLDAVDNFFTEKSHHFWESIFNEWIERCKSCISAKGNYF